MVDRRGRGRGKEFAGKCHDLDYLDQIRDHALAHASRVPLYLIAPHGLTHILLGLLTD